MYDHRWTVEAFGPGDGLPGDLGVERCSSRQTAGRSTVQFYDVVIDAYAQIIADLSPSQQDALFFANATKVYSLDV